ncbi:MAG: hypothetical protein AVDCRST_MAG75-1086 [uncultured Propionibacteriaceae bacterium]|uniref:EVE domain-containing protein n=1 Tax=uncultured Propionibacteriaceae bacterium TaxID=257457 RepID=A0A6J4NFA9_9ACTN|nr:MAG: hypothetical protein AVDCRST_MAG75-1086 [uncultured Propionibacteriaceae bacterium]
MAGKSRLSAADIACWVIKSRRAPAAIAAGWRPGHEQRLNRCLRRSYRVELMQPGQRCLLWLSGRDQPGVQAIGTLLSQAEIPPVGADDPEAEVRVSLRLLQQPIPRSTLLADPVFTRAEVLRMPAGSNPSYLTWDQVDTLRDFVDPREWEAAGW